MYFLDDEMMILGKKIKQIRKQQHLTLEQLGEKIGCSKSYISQLENGSTSPSISMLGRIAKVLKIPVTELFEEDYINNRQTKPDVQEDASLIQGNTHLVKADQRMIHYPDGKTTSYLLTRGVYQKTMQPLLTVVKPGGRSDGEKSIIHPVKSEEFVFMIKGSLEFTVGSEVYILDQGDTLYFNGSTPHSWINKSKEIAEILFVWTPPVW
jgi:transcriptional regulator with XRE-family HTH domain